MREDVVPTFAKRLATLRAELLRRGVTLDA
jgi:hypothetical protein